ncbi:MET1 [Auxenochlorella protothecoides x Auxenochlorella symbiontica]
MPPSKSKGYLAVGKQSSVEAMVAGITEPLGKEGASKRAGDLAAKDTAKKARGDASEAIVKPEVTVGSGRQAAQNLKLKDEASALPSAREQRLAVKEYTKAASEAEALELTRGDVKEEGEGLPRRRIGDFTLATPKGIHEPVLSIEAGMGVELILSGVVFPAAGPTTKASGASVAACGPVTGFRLEVDAGPEAQVVLSTPLAEYILLKPAPGYKKTFGNLFVQAALVREVCLALSPAKGGDLEASLDEVILRLARSKLDHGYASAREALLINAKLVIAQLSKLDDVSGPKGLKYLLTECGKALVKEAASYKYVGVQRPGATGIHIRDDTRPEAAPADEDAQTLADADFARQLQAQMDATAARAARGGAKPRGPAYVQVSAEEIANDYPAPLAYAKEEEEVDELLLADEEELGGGADPETLPRRLLTDFSVYNAEGWLASLELLPMWAGVDPSVELYASGVVLEDDGDFSGGQALQEESAAPVDEGAGGSSSAAPPAEDAAGGSSSAAPPAEDAAGVRMCLSQVKDWVVEMGPDMLLISLRTDVAWYRLSVPAAKYAPWFRPVLQTARLAARVLTWLSEESRASKLSFNDVVKRLVASPDTALALFKKPEAVERYLLVHGAILLNQFAAWPVAAVRKSAFATTLRARMQDVRHSKLYRAAAKPARSGAAVNRNPMKDRAAGGRSKPMTATATTMVRAVWQSYFTVAGAGALVAEAGEVEAGEQQAQAGVVAREVEEDENADEGEEDAQESALAAVPAVPVAVAKMAGGAHARRAAPAAAVVAWTGEALRTEGGCTFYPGARVGDLELRLGDAVALGPPVDEDEAVSGDEGQDAAPRLPQLGLVQALWQRKGGKGGDAEVQVRLLVRGHETVLGDAASTAELFLATGHETRPLASVAALVSASRLERAWDQKRRGEYFRADEELRQANAAAAAEGAPLTHFWRRQYVPEEGIFRDAPADLQLGSRLPDPQIPETGVQVQGKGFRKDGVRYLPGDFLFLGPEVFDAVEGARSIVQLPEYLSNSRFHKGSHVGLRAWGIAQLIGVESSGKGKGAACTLTVRRFYRPEDIHEDKAYEAPSFHAVYASSEEVEVEVVDVQGPCTVGPPGSELSVSSFECIGTYNRATGEFGPVPEDLKQAKGSASDASNAAPASAKAADKGKAAVDAFPGDDGVSLASMDIFAGCGGLSEGMHQAGAAHARWAIEYERPAAEAFRLNNPRAATFCANCNVLLHAAMVKGGGADDCQASPEAVAESEALPADQVAALPLPGEVDFICGGPPCQGYSGMNRFNKGNWSMVQNSMVMSFLSYADYYRPRYFLLENVRNFVSHNKSFTFRLTLRCLLDMGYQVRFGVLNAGNFGVAQSRKRTFIWAAAPGEGLPDWPRLMHAFRTPQLTINLPNGVQYTAVPQTVGAPLRPVTVRDAISDLPVIANGHDVEEMEYQGEPVSAFQRAVRGGCPALYDHISKNMNELNLERCRCIPKGVPGADWRVLEEIVKSDPSREKFNGQPLVPWCLPNTADRHNGWRGLFGRLDPRGHFPTSTTDPQPMGKVGQVFHPTQDRIVSVRECARAQGFPDKHRFYGNVHNKHRQVGNAVPPPLAAALGRQLRKKLEEKLERGRA